MAKADLTKILAVLNRRIQAWYARELPGTGIKYGLIGYIMCICNNPGQSQEQIAGMMAVEKSSVAKAAKQLLDESYVKRNVNPDSRREYVLLPTAKARAARKAFLPIKQRVDAHVTRDMTNIERDLFLRLLAKIPLD